MKFNCGPTYREKIEQKEKWHVWFAWYPIRIGQTRDCRWLEKVWRKGRYTSNNEGAHWSWKYQEYGLNLTFPARSPDLEG